MMTNWLTHAQIYCARQRAFPSGNRQIFNYIFLLNRKTRPPMKDDNTHTKPQDFSYIHELKKNCIKKVRLNLRNA